MEIERMEEEPEHAHYEQSGYSVMAMGFFALALYAGVVLTGTEMGFIRPPGILAIGGLFLTVGSVMVRHGRYREPNVQVVRTTEANTRS